MAPRPTVPRGTEDPRISPAATGARVVVKAVGDGGPSGSIPARPVGVLIARVAPPTLAPALMAGRRGGRVALDLRRPVVVRPSRPGGVATAVPPCSAARPRKVAPTKTSRTAAVRTASGAEGRGLKTAVGASTQEVGVPEGRVAKRAAVAPWASSGEYWWEYRSGRRGARAWS